MEYLRGNGVSEEQLARIKAPAGLDLGRIKHEEMAVAVIAEIVQRKALDGNQPGAGAMHKPAEATVPVEMPAAEAPETEKLATVPAASEMPDLPVKQSADPAGPEEAIDPVCEMTVTVKGARYHAEHEGQTYYFCCPACRKLFQNNPQDYLKVKQDA